MIPTQVKVWVVNNGFDVIGIYTTKELAISKAQEYLTQAATSIYNFRVRQQNAKIDSLRRQMTGNQMADMARELMITAEYEAIDALPPVPPPPEPEELGASTAHPDGTTRLGRGDFTLFINSYPLIGDLYVRST